MSKWKMWFAWRPVRDENGKWYWMEWVEYKKEWYCGYDIHTAYNYRSPR